MDKFKKGLLFASLCIVAVAGSLVASKQLSANAEHWVSLVGVAFGALAHFLPSLLVADSSKMQLPEQK
jgi:hypothetical protein